MALPVRAAVWNVTTVDSAGDVGQYSSLAILPSGQPAIAYDKHHYGVVHSLEYAWCDGNDWHRRTVDDAGGRHTSLAILPSGQPAISYFDEANADLRYASLDGAGEWQKVTVDSEGDAGTETSLAILPSGQPAIAYKAWLEDYGVKYAWFDGRDWHTSNVTDWATYGISLAILPSGEPVISSSTYTSGGILRYAWLEDGNWQTATVDNTWTVGHYTSLAVLPSGHPAIGYSGENHLKYAWFDGSAWHREVVDDSVSVLGLISLVILPSGYPAISYRDGTNGDLKYAWFSGTVWRTETVDSEGDVGGWNSLAVLLSGQPAISYYDSDNADLKYASRVGCNEDSDCDDGTVCTTDGCEQKTRACVHEVNLGSCLIAGMCSLNGEVNPANECQECNPVLDQEAWSPKVEGAACAGDENECTDDVCNAGVCTHPSRPSGTSCADDGNDCTDDVCAGNVCVHPNLPLGMACGDPAATECDKPDVCDGGGECTFNFEPDGTACADDGAYCNGKESCAEGECRSEGDPCAAQGQACDEQNNECFALPIVFVDGDADGDNNGASWDDAYNDLQDALAAAPACPLRTVVWIAAGTYAPTAPNGDRTAAFHLRRCVGLYGGFAGHGEPDPDERDIVGHPTILSGDLNGDDGANPATRGENSYHVVVASGSNETGILHGVTVTAGNADGSDSDAYGGGMYFRNASPTVIECTVVHNSADRLGGGLYNTSGDPVLTECNFSGNSMTGRFGDGGGVYNFYGDPILTRCLFSGNSTGTFGASGGGMCTNYGNPTLTDCVFRQNRADGYNNKGGGMSSAGGRVTLTGCTFIGNSVSGEYTDGGGLSGFQGELALIGCSFHENSAQRGGGGLRTREADLTLNNCLFSGNSAENGGGIDHHAEGIVVLTNCTFQNNSAAGRGGGFYNYDCSPTLHNCLFVGNSAGQGGGMSNNFNSSTDTTTDPVLTNCTFHDNSATQGGAVYNYLHSDPTLINCLLWGNTASEGGGVFNYDRCNSVLTNCTFVANSASQGKAVACDSPHQLGSSAVGMANCILWDGGNEVSNSDNSTITIMYSVVHGGWPGETNSEADPLFADFDFRLSASSPCLDAGDPEFVPSPGLGDLDGHCRVLCNRVDIGAYEFGIGDYDCSRIVGLSDFAAWDGCMLGPAAVPGFGAPGCVAFDFDANGNVDLIDFAGFQGVLTNIGR